jgi:uncharacterized protein YktA (UPF0223 family)
MASLIKRKLRKDQWQKDFIKTKGDKILCCGRQVGKTEICAEDCGEYVQKPDNPYPVLMTAPTERQAYLLFTKTLDYLMANCPRLIKMGKHRPTKTKITLNNGILIYCLPVGATGLGIRGITVGRSYEDENARVPDEVEEAIAPMLLTTGGARIKLSTPYGATGEFYNTWINKDDAYNSYTRFSVTTETVILEREICYTWTEKQKEGALRLIEQAKARMSKRQYAQEFLGEFVTDLFRYFPDDLIKACCTQKRQTFKPNKNYFLGVDIARMGEDEGTFEVLQKVNNETILHVENIVTRKKLTTETEDRIILMNKQYNFNKIFIDAGSGSLGVGIFDHLLRHEEVSRKVEAINNSVREYDRHHKTSTKLLKEDLYDNLRSLMERGFIKLLDDDEVIESLRSVQYEYNQRAGRPTTLKIYGNYTHIVEGLIRAAWGAKGKSLNVWISSIRV